MRGGNPLQLTATLEEREKDAPAPPTAQPVSLAKNEPVLGFSVREQGPAISRTTLASDSVTVNSVPVTSEQATQIVVSEVDPLGPAAESGLIKGHIILEANRQPVRRLEDFNRLTANLSQGSVLILRVSAPQQRVIRLVALRVGGD